MITHLICIIFLSLIFCSSSISALTKDTKAIFLLTTTAMIAGANFMLISVLSHFYNSGMKCMKKKYEKSSFYVFHTIRSYEKSVPGLCTETAGQGFEPAAGCPSILPVTTLARPPRLILSIERIEQKQLRAISVVLLYTASRFLPP